MLGQNPYAEEALAAASMARNQGGMLRTSAPIGNEQMLSSGPMDKLGNPQPYNNSGYTKQGMEQNMRSAIPQAQANAVRGMRKNQTDMSQAEYKAEQLRATRTAEVLYANDGGAAVMKLNALQSDPASHAEFMRRIGESKLMAQGNNPQLAFQSTNFRA